MCLAGLLVDNQKEGGSAGGATPREGFVSDSDDEKEGTPEFGESERRSLVDRIGGLAGSAAKIAAGAKGVSFAIGKAILNSPEQLRNMQETGRYLKDVREVAGLTRKELSEAIELADESLLQAVENGTATLSFELILRLASLLARHDPVPFALKFVRTYNPELWGMLQNWGLDKIPLHYERERKFINIYRSHDAARELSEEGFEKILGYTNAAFEMALHFVEEEESDSEEETSPDPSDDLGK